MGSPPGNRAWFHEVRRSIYAAPTLRPCSTRLVDPVVREGTTVLEAVREHVRPHLLVARRSRAASNTITAKPPRTARQTLQPDIEPP
jgi:hypothetical protein